MGEQNKTAELPSNWHRHHVAVEKAALQMVRNALRTDGEAGRSVRLEMLQILDEATHEIAPSADPAQQDTKVDALRTALALAIRQNSHDMLMTGEEIRQCEAALAAQQAPSQPPAKVVRTDPAQPWTVEHLKSYPTEALVLLNAKVEREGLTEEDRAILAAVVRELGKGDAGNAPGHAHAVPGIWDSDNGNRAGKPCAWCLCWAKFTMLAAAHGIPAPTAGEKGEGK